MALCPEHPKRDQDPKFTPLSETSIPVGFIWESPPPPGACTQISLLGCGVEAGSTPNRVKKKVSEVILTTLEINAIQIFYLVAAENESFRVIKRERRSRYVTLPWQHRILKKCSQKFTDHFNAI